MVEDRVERPKSRSAAKVAAWAFGVIAAAATLWLIYLLVAIAVEWPTYVGHESGTAVAILMVVGVAPAALAWLAFAVAFVLARRGRRLTTG